MKNILSVNFRLARPEAYPGKGDKYLPKIIQDLSKLQRKTQKDFRYDALRLSADKIRDLSQTLVEFAEDVHNDIGIWDSLEQYNLEFFGTKLPLIPGSDEGAADQASINKRRLQYLLWNQYQLFDPELILSPSHQDLVRLSEMVSDFLSDRFKNLPLGSGIKTFFNQPDEFGWDIKKKLIWLGKHSYLFRRCYQDYIQLHGGKPETAVIDDFICQETTDWSGLGVIDILASILKITENQRQDLRNWYERHTAFYKVLSINESVVTVLNIINDKPYIVRVGDFSSQFDKNHLYFGGLVPWNGEWYWSGEQKRYDSVSDEDLPQLKNTFFSTPQTIVYRYRKDLADKARESVKEQYRIFVDYHGKDMAVYPDGRSMAVDMRKQYCFHNESKLKAAGKNPTEHHQPEIPDFTKSFPPDFIECNNGVCIYFNPDEGQEIIQDFFYIVSGFKKRGINLNDDELNAIRGFLEADAISPGFINKLVQEYGDESIRVAFLIPDKVNPYYLDYLFRKHKGHFYRKRYPAISLLNIPDQAKE
jgi:hypothetical protein